MFGGRTGPEESAAQPVQRSNLIGPAAQLLLQGLGLTALDVTPTGPGGIVTKGDVLEAAARGITPGKAPSVESEEKLPSAAVAVANGGGEAVKLPPAAPQPVKAPQAAPAAPKQQPLERVQPSEAGRRRNSDSKLRGILAAKMLQDGERIPDAWLRDWVGAPKARAQ